MIRRRDGKVFVVRLLPKSESHLDVKSIDLGITTQEIIDFIEEGCKAYE